MIKWSDHLNRDGQPRNRGFHAASNRHKLALCLRGILDAIKIEGLKDSEIVFLQAWLDAVDAIKQDGDLLDIADLVRDILRDGQIEDDEREELESLVSDILEFGDNVPTSTTDFINQLIGFCKGIAADNYISDKEIHALRRELKSDWDAEDIWPASDLATRIDVILADGVITDAEREELLEAIKAMTGARFTDTGLAEGLAVSAFCEDMPDKEIEGLAVCFTGKCLTASRSKLHDDALERGAVVKTSLSPKVDVLVVGEIASRDWAYTSHGRKIERALSLKKEGCSMAIVSEVSWVNRLAGL